MDQQGAITYRGDSYRARLNAHAYEMATISRVTPYDKLPQITLDGMLPYHPGGFDFTYQTEAVRFDRDLKDDFVRDEDGNPDFSAGAAGRRLDENISGIARANGTRLNAAPAISLPMEASYGFLTPKLKYVYTHYDLDLDSQGKAQAAAQASRPGYGSYSSSLNRNVPIFSVDSGLLFRSQYPVVRQELPPNPRTAPVLPLRSV